MRAHLLKDRWQTLTCLAGQSWIRIHHDCAKLSPQQQADLQGALVVGSGDYQHSARVAEFVHPNWSLICVRSQQLCEPGASTVHFFWLFYNFKVLYWLYSGIGCICIHPLKLYIFSVTTWKRNGPNWGYTILLIFQKIAHNIQIWEKSIYFFTFFFQMKNDCLSIHTQVLSSGVLVQPVTSRNHIISCMELTCVQWKWHHMISVWIHLSLEVCCRM